MKWRCQKQKNEGDGSSIYFLCAYNMIYDIYGYLLNDSYIEIRFYREV
jgi:hypothetical protein